jgi:hypothetical protein
MSGDTPYHSIRGNVNRSAAFIKFPPDRVAQCRLYFEKRYKTRCKPTISRGGIPDTPTAAHGDARSSDNRCGHPFLDERTASPTLEGGDIQGSTAVMDREG